MPSRGSAATDYRTYDFSITGMTCAACAARVTNALALRDGVSAEVNLATERATITAPMSVQIPDLVEDIERLGFRAHPNTMDVDDRQIGDSSAGRVRDLRKRLIVAGLLFMPLCDASLAFTFVPWTRFEGWQIVTILLAAPVAWAAWPILSAALGGVRHRTFTMDTLVSMGILTSTAWSLYAMFALIPHQSQTLNLSVLTHPASGALYLDVAAGVTTFVLAGRYYEALSRKRAGDVLKRLAASRGKEAALVHSDGTETIVPIDRLSSGDRIAVRCGSKIAADGVVVAGEALVDRSLVTGESALVLIADGDHVVGGTTAAEGYLLVEVTAVGEETQLGQMVRLLERAQNEKAAVQRLADRLAGVFVPCVIGLSSVTFLAWLSMGGSLERAMSAGLAVLIVACPCALGLATPTALMVASARGSELGIFIKGYETLERTRQVDTILLDKTGTVTEGALEVTRIEAADGIDGNELLRLAGTVENASEHAVGRAITRAATSLGTLREVSRFRSFPGQGVQGDVDGREILVGSAAFMKRRGVRLPGADSGVEEPQSVGAITTVAVAADGVLLGSFGLSDTVKPSASAAIKQLHDRGLKCIILTGDTTEAAERVSSAIGVDGTIGDALPQDKVQEIRDLQSFGRCVAFVGDGVNDAAAIATADLGLAVGSGTDVAIEAAEMVLLRDDLTILPVAIDLARRTLRTIHGNLVWAFAYNLAALPLAAFGLLNPLVAGGCMAISSAFVVWNSSRLRHAGRSRLDETDEGSRVVGFKDSEPKSSVEVNASLLQLPA